MKIVNSFLAILLLALIVSCEVPMVHVEQAQKAPQTFEQFLKDKNIEKSNDGYTFDGDILLSALDAENLWKTSQKSINTRGNLGVDPIWGTITKYNDADKLNITYAFQGDVSVGGLSNAQVRQAFKDATAKWQSAANIRFREDSGLFQSRVNIKVEDFWFDEASWAARGEWPFSWTSGFSPQGLSVNKAYRPATTEDMKRVFLHELGHILGLAHEHKRSDAPQSAQNLSGWELPGQPYGSYDPLSIMHYGNGVTDLSPGDYAAVQYLYGPPSNPIPTGPYDPGSYSNGYYFPTATVDPSGNWSGGYYSGAGAATVFSSSPSSGLGRLIFNLPTGKTYSLKARYYKTAAMGSNYTGKVVISGNSFTALDTPQTLDVVFTTSSGGVYIESSGSNGGGVTLDNIEFKDFQPLSSPSSIPLTVSYLQSFGAGYAFDQNAGTASITTSSAVQGTITVHKNAGDKVFVTAEILKTIAGTGYRGGSISTPESGAISATSSWSSIVLQWDTGDLVLDSNGNTGGSLQIRNLKFFKPKAFIPQTLIPYLPNDVTYNAPTNTAFAQYLGGSGSARIDFVTTQPAKYFLSGEMISINPTANRTNTFTTPSGSFTSDGTWRKFVSTWSSGNCILNSGGVEGGGIATRNLIFNIY